MYELYNPFYFNSPSEKYPLKPQETCTSYAALRQMTHFHENYVPYIDRLSD